jgi:hypothetical protein
MDDEQEEHTIGSLDTSMDRYLEHHGLWRKRIPQGFKRKFVVFFCIEICLVLFRWIKFISCGIRRCKDK